MPGTRTAGTFDEFLSPGQSWQKVLVPQHDLLKRFGTSTTKLNIAQNVFVHLLQLSNSFRIADIESFTVFLNYV